MAGTIRKFLPFSRVHIGRQGITLSGRRHTRVDYLTPVAKRKPRPTAKIFVTDIQPQAKCLELKEGDI